MTAASKVATTAALRVQRSAGTTVVPRGGRWVEM